MNNVEAIAQELKRRGLTLWTFPGGTVYPLYHACHQAGVPVLVTKTEFGAAYMAIGAAKATGQAQVVAVTSGPGATNIVTACAEAYYDSVPIVFLCGQVASANVREYSSLRQRGFQHAPIAEICEPISVLSLNGDDLAYYFRLAMYYSTKGRGGPVVLEMPMDCQMTEASTEEPEISEPRGGLTPHWRDTMAGIAQALDTARRPLILAGAGCMPYSAELRALVADTGIPVVASLRAVGILPTDDSRYLGMIGYAGHPRVNKAVQDCDLLLVLGARLDVRQTGTLPDRFAPNARIIRVDIDHDELRETRVRASIQINADCGEVLRELAQYGLKMHYTAGATVAVATNDMAQAVADIGAQYIGRDCIFTTGVGSHQLYAARLLSLDYPRRMLLTSAGHGCMGAGLPMAIGAALATGRQAVLIDGDGSFQHSIAELATLKETGAQVDIHVINNSNGGLVTQFARSKDWLATETTWRTPPLAEIAKAYGVKIAVHDVKECGIWPVLEAGHELDDMTGA